jgi:hypothetical protein
MNLGQNLVPTYPPVYALDKSGKIRYFQTHLRPLNIYSQDEPDAYELATITGLVGGKPSQKLTIIKKANKGNTIFEQAKVAINKEFTDKLNEGYKSVGDLLSYAAARDIPIPDGADVAEMYRVLKIKYNTDTRWYPLPMLADKYEKHKNKVAFPGYVQPKLNGVRCLALWDKDDDKVVLVSRGGKTYQIPFLEAQLKPFFQTNPHTILDGEIFCKGKRLQTISGAARREKDAPDWLEYHVYDIVSDEPQSARLEKADTMVFILRMQWNAKNVYSVPHHPVASHDEIKQWHDYYVSEGYEGLMYRNPSGRYGVSFRVTELLKVKEFLDEEFEIIGGKITEGKTIGESFVFELRNNTNDKTFFARPTGTVEEKEYWYANFLSYIGLKATVRFQERTADDLPHQGHIRSDNTKCLTIEELDPRK